MFSIRENIPVIVGIIVVAVVAWILWREVSKMKKTMTTMVKEHNETAAILDQHKNAINGLSTQMISGGYDEYDDEDEIEPLDDEEEEEEQEQKLPTIVEMPESSGKAKKRA